MGWSIAIVLDFLSDAFEEVNDGDNITDTVAKAHGGVRPQRMKMEE
jgi:hypothetical protein